jgi:hypothetical protein
LGISISKVISNILIKYFIDNDVIVIIDYSKIFSSIIFIILQFIFIKFYDFDPIYSGFIINEEALILTSKYRNKISRYVSD